MNDVEEIKSRLNIVDVIGGYVKLIPAGSNYKALCPFHHEKTPSFTVNEERQVFHCFGCGKGGDIFTFIQEIEGVNFREALKILADRAGITLKGYDKKKTQEKSQVREIIGEAVAIFCKNLKSPAGEKARQYLKERGVTEAMLKKFSLGFALDDWRGLFNSLNRLGFKAEGMKKAGLIIERERDPGGFYDRFRNRIMFPIFNSYGEPLGFSGRVLPGEDSKMGKYINTPQTEVYDKSQAIYGINLAKNAIKQKDRCILLEGNLDVVMSHLAGIENAVATCGTAVTEGQIKIIQRYSNNIAFAFDVDEAGIKASKKGVDLALSLGANAEAINLRTAGKGNKDVADVVQKDPKKWRALARQAKPAMEYYFEIVLKDYQKSDANQKKKLLEELLDKIALLPSKIDQAYYLEKLADDSNTRPEALYDVFNEKLEALANQSGNRFYQEESSDEEKDSEAGESEGNIESTKIVKLLNRVIALIVFYPQLLKKMNKEKLQEALVGLKDSVSKEIIEIILNCGTRFSSPNRYLGLIKDERLKTRTAQLITIAENRFNAYNEGQSRNDFSPKDDFDFCLKQLTEILRREKMDKLMIQIKEAEKAKDKATLAKLIKAYNLLLRKK